MVKKWVALLILLSAQGYACETQYVFTSKERIKGEALIKDATVNFTSIISIKEATLNGDNGWWAIKLDGLKGGTDLSALSTPFAFKLNKDGLIVDYWFPVLLTRLEEGALMRFATYFQYIHPKGGEVITESEVNERFSYQYTYDEESRTIGKSRLYAIQPTYKEPEQSYEVLDSYLEISPSDCFFEYQKGDEQIKVRSKMAALNYTTHHTFTLFEKKEALNSELFLLPEELSSWSIMNKKALPPAKEPDEIKKELNILKEAKVDIHLLAEELIALEGSYETIYGMIKSEAFNPNESMNILAAFGIVDNTQSQKILLSVIDDPELGNDARFQAIQSLKFGNSRLSEQTAQTLVTLIENGTQTDSDLVQGSLLPSIGIMIGKRPEGESKEQVMSAIEGRLATAQSAWDLGQLLVAAGNTSDSRFEPTAISYTKSSSSYLRTHSAYALGKIQSESGYEALSSMLTKEDNTKVQREVIRSISNYNLKDKEVNTLTNIAISSTNPNTRLEVIKVISKQPTDVRKPHLQQLLRNERDNGNLKAIIASMRE